MWAARAYDDFGSVELFEALKEPFLELLLRNDVDHDVKRNMTQRLVIAAIHTLRPEGNRLVELPEVRRVLRRADALVRRTAAWRLRLELEKGDYLERGKTWRELIGPVFEAIWPPDVDLRDAECSDNLVRLALAAGDAVDEAADAVLPYLVKHQESIQIFYFETDENNRPIAAQHSATIVKLLDAVVDNNVSQPYRDFLREVLDRLASVNDTIISNRHYSRLTALVNQ